MATLVEILVVWATSPASRQAGLVFLRNIQLQVFIIGKNANFARRIANIFKNPFPAFSNTCATSNR